MDQFLSKALAHYKAKLAEETVRFGVQAAYDELVTVGTAAVPDMNLWKQLSKQTGHKYIVLLTSITGEPNTHFFVVAQTEIPRPHEFYKLWYAVQYLEVEPDPNDLQFMNQEKLDFLDKYDGPYKLEVPNDVLKTVFE